MSSLIFRTPSYYNKFRCTADSCTDNCCIGWEIDIDSDTAAYYKSVKGDFGKRLKENISDENFFILKGERCPFLNEKNLCDIIINCGENRLCQICRDHPRYFEWYGKIKEGGVGLSCEEGARLILTNDGTDICEGVADEYEDEIDGELLSVLIAARDTLFDVLRSKLPLRKRLTELLAYAEALQLQLDNPHLDEISFTPDRACVSSLDEFFSLYADFEPIDDSWTEELRRLSELPTREAEATAFKTVQAEEYATRLAVYFLWRYFLKGAFDSEILSKVKFAVVSSLVIGLMVGDKSNLAVWTKKSKLYSKQMEYSDENRELFYDYSYEKKCLSSSALISLINRIC